jgi:hypothetical protein
MNIIEKMFADINDKSRYKVNEFIALLLFTYAQLPLPIKMAVTIPTYSWYRHIILCCHGMQAFSRLRFANH